jgi:hypothetical protein
MSTVPGTVVFKVFFVGSYCYQFCGAVSIFFGSTEYLPEKYFSMLQVFDKIVRISTRIRLSNTDLVILSSVRSALKKHVTAAHVSQVDAAVALNWQMDAADAQNSSPTDVATMLAQIVQVHHSTDD